MYSSSIAAVTNYHKRGGLKETQSYYFTILEFGNPVPGKYDCIPSRGSRGNPAPASPGSRGGPHPPARSPALREAGSAGLPSCLTFVTFAVPAALSRGVW